MKNFLKMWLFIMIVFGVPTGAVIAFIANIEKHPYPTLGISFLAGTAVFAYFCHKEQLEKDRYKKKGQSIG